MKAPPKSVFTHVGGKTFIWRYRDGHAVRTEVETRRGMAIGLK